MRAHILAASLLAGCLPEAPAEPSYAADVEPILAAQCVRCHSGDGQIGGAPPYFRLDTFDGASRMATFIAARAGVMGEMPPGGPELNQYQRDVLINWAKQTVKVEGDRAGNRPPVVTVEAAVVEGELLVSYEVDDPDGDRATGQLELGILGLSTAIHAGRDSLSFDARSWKTGTYELVLTASDGFSEPVVATASVNVNNAEVLPFATVLAPDILRHGVDSSVSMTALSCQRLEGGDCDVAGSEELIVDIHAVRGSEKHALRTGVRFKDGQSARIPLDKVTIDGLPPAINWRLAIEVKSPTGSRTVLSSPFIVSDLEDGPRLAEVKPLYEKYCTPCHGTTVEDTPTPDVRFIEPCVDAENPDGCYRLNFLQFGDYVYRRVQVYQNMPPRSAIELVGVEQPTQAERKLMSDWILAGGPL
jgi:hypothetical protein